MSLKKSKDKDLANLNIELNLSDPENKNGVAIVDKAIQELEKELVKLSPEGKAVSASELAQATLALNSRIRNRELSSHEILFSREQNSGDNIALDDKRLSDKKMEQKVTNHKHSENSKFKGYSDPSSAGTVKGDRVYLKEDGGKHNLRELYVVTASDDQSVTLVKLLYAHDNTATTKLGSKNVVVKQTDIYLAESNRRSAEVCEKEEPANDDPVEEHESEDPKPKSINKKRLVSVWSPFLTEHSISDSDDTEDCFITSEDDETNSDSSQNGIGVDISDNSTSIGNSVPDKILDMQFNQLQDLVDSIQDEREYATPPEEEDHNSDSPDDGSVTDHPLMPHNDVDVAQNDVLQTVHNEQNEMMNNSININPRKVTE